MDSVALSPRGGVTGNYKILIVREIVFRRVEQTNWLFNIRLSSLKKYIYAYIYLYRLSTLSIYTHVITIKNTKEVSNSRALLA